MPVWLERIVLRNAGVEYLPALVCVGLAVAVWWWQWSRRAKRSAGGAGGAGGSLRIGWGPGMAVVSLVVLAVAAFAVMTGMSHEAWLLVQKDPWLAAWWVMGVGGAVALWGVAVHAWRGEGRLARQCRCGYDMTAVGGMKCPECGRQAKGERQLRPFNIRRGALWVAAAVIAAGLLLPSGVRVWQRGLAAALPSRTLLWWMTSTGDPPGSVLREAVFRAGQEPLWWQSEIDKRSGAIAERMIECGPERQAEYAVFFRSTPGTRPNGEAYGIAITNVQSADPRRRRNAAALLVAMGGWGAPLSAVEALLADSDPTAQANGRILITGVVAEVMQRLTGTGGKAKETDPARVRELIRLLCEMPLNSYYGGPAQLEPLCASPDPEVAARAAVMRNRWMGSLTTGTRTELRAALLGAKALRDLKQPPVAGGVSIATYLWRPEGLKDVGALLEDADPTVRSELLTEVDAATAPMLVYFVPGNTTYWSPLIELMEARVKNEPDAALKALLVKLAARIKGKPESDQAAPNP